MRGVLFILLLTIIAGISLFYEGSEPPSLHPAALERPVSEQVPHDGTSAESKTPALKESAPAEQTPAQLLEQREAAQEEGRPHEYD